MSVGSKSVCLKINAEKLHDLAKTDLLNKKLLVLLLSTCLTLLFYSAPAMAEETAKPAQTLWYFWRDDCPFCQQAEPWLDQLEQQYPGWHVKRLDVINDSKASQLFTRMMRERGYTARSVPTFIIDMQVWEGFSPRIAQAIESRMAGEDQSGFVISFGPLGEVDLAARSLVMATTLIAFVDGFNPCSLWVLTVLLAMIIGSRSRARIAAVGLTFLLVTALIYGLFIAGLFATFTIIGQLVWIQVAVAMLALLFGLVNIKDYFAFKQGLSFTIPDRFKPTVYRGGRELRKERPLLLTLAMTVAMAAGVALIELPCTAGFPMVWSNLVAQAGAGKADFVLLLGVYLLVYLSVEITILLAAVITLSAMRMQERGGRILKLFGGMIMLALALVLLIDPAIMESLSGSLLVVGGAAMAALLVLLLDKYRAARRAG